MAGRPTDFKESYIQDAVAICEMGATIQELADAFGVNRSTVYRWANSNPVFCNAIKVGKAPADDRVERSLYNKAVGYTTTDTKRKYSISKAKNGRDVRTLVSEEIHEKTMAPDTVAGIFWLKNRRTDTWQDRRTLDADVILNVGDGLPDRELKQRVLGMLKASNSAPVTH